MTDSTGSGARPLVEVLAEVPDFRKSQGRRHPLGAVLALAFAATLCGYKSYGAMAQWGKNDGSELAQALGFQDGKTPSVGTLFTCGHAVHHLQQLGQARPGSQTWKPNWVPGPKACWSGCLLTAPKTPKTPKTAAPLP